MTTEVKKIKKDAYQCEECVIVPPVDIYETDNEYILKADMPGVIKENLAITLDNNRLEINGKVVEDESEEGNLKYSEYKLYNFHREFNVGKDINGNAITAKLDHGVLTLIMPKKEEVKPKKLEIKYE
jgi:HSP20 family protein